MSLSSDIKRARNGVDAVHDEVLMRWAVRAEMMENIIKELTVPRLIDTAPHDEVLLFDPEDRTWYVDIGDIDYEGEDGAPTHWLPLPEARP